MYMSNITKQLAIQDLPYQSNCLIVGVTFSCKTFFDASSLTSTVSSAKQLHTGSYMSAHVLLNLLNELGKSDEIQGLPSILSLFHKF